MTDKTSQLVALLDKHYPAPKEFSSSQLLELINKDGDKKVRATAYKYIYIMLDAKLISFSRIIPQTDTKPVKVYKRTGRARITLSGANGNDWFNNWGGILAQDIILNLNSNSNSNSNSKD